MIVLEKEAQETGLEPGTRITRKGRNNFQMSGKKTKGRPLASERGKRPMGSSLTCGILALKALDGVLEGFRSKSETPRGGAWASS